MSGFHVPLRVMDVLHHPHTHLWSSTVWHDRTHSDLRFVLKRHKTGLSLKTWPVPETWDLTWTCTNNLWASRTYWLLSYNDELQIKGFCTTHSTNILALWCSGCLVSFCWRLPCLCEFQCGRDLLYMKSAWRQLMLWFAAKLIKLTRLVVSDLSDLLLWSSSWTLSWIIYLMLVVAPFLMTPISASFERLREASAVK